MGQGLTRFVNGVKFHGGPRQYLLQLCRVEDPKVGILVGEDSHGNKYYENNYYMFGRNRWVVYNDKFGYDYDASHVPSEWFGWLHYKTDLVPHQDPGRLKYKWMIDDNVNLTGTNKQYVPYSTTKPKIHAWVPRNKN